MNLGKIIKKELNLKQLKQIVKIKGKINKIEKEKIDRVKSYVEIYELTRLQPDQPRVKEERTPEQKRHHSRLRGHNRIVMESFLITLYLQYLVIQLKLDN